MTVAISYSFVKNKSSQQRVFGLEVAVLNWLRAFFRYSRQSQFPFLIDSKTSLEEIEEQARAIGLNPQAIMAIDSRFPQENLSQFNTVFRPDSATNHLLWQRALLSGSGFAFCGLAHALAGWESGNILEQYCLAPSAKGDAIICPSRAIKSVIESFWATYSDYLEQRFGAKFKCPVQLPIIPLGIDLERFTHICTPEKRAEQRKTLGAKDNDIIVLWVGRLSSAIKGHPLPMFRAVEEAAKKTGARVRFVMQGYFVPEEQGEDFQNLAQDICKTATVEFISSNDQRFPDGLWAAGDIFMSLIENPQESFGLTPIEAIAAGLPRVLSDWDGYRDCVENGVDGFAIPTIQPPPGQGRDLSTQILGGKEIYGGFLAKTALSIAVDHEAATQALVQLIENPDLRRQLAEAAKKRLSDYNWKNIIPAYEQLWDDLAAERLRTLEGSPRPVWSAIPPQVPDPFTMYAAFPTRALRETDRLSIIATTDEIKLLWRHKINTIVLDVLPPPDELTKIINWISAQKNPSVKEILIHFQNNDEAALWRALTWLLKLGIARIAS